MLVSDITDRVSELLQDNDATTPNVTWTVPELIGWVNDSIRALIGVRPDASSTTVSMLLSAGTKQSLGTSDSKLLRVSRNMGSDGSTPGKVITLADMETMDRFNPNWHTDAASTVVSNYLYDERRPKEFWVYPQVPASPAVYVEVMKSVIPADVAAVGDTLPVDAIYAPALINWCVYRALSRDSIDTPNAARAQQFKNDFFAILQVKTGSDRGSDPNVREMAPQQK